MRIETAEENFPCSIASKSGVRNHSIDFFRCVLMLGIIAQHVVGQGAYIRHGVDFLTNWCVCGFVFVSGYYGIKFRPSKFISLICLGAFCAVVSNMAHGVGFCSSLQAVRWYWYLWAYLFLMLIAPLINTAFEHGSKKQVVEIVLPFIFLIYGWSFAAGLPWFRDWMPVCKYIGSLNGVSLVGLYVFTLAYRKLELNRFITFKSAVIVLPICVALMFAGFWSYAWIPSFIVTCFAFEFFKNIKLPLWLGNIFVFMAPSMFSIYLLHICNCNHLMADFERYCIEDVGMPFYIMVVVVTFVTFFICLSVDLLRRCVLIPLRPLNGWLFANIDKRYFRLLTVA